LPENDIPAFIRGISILSALYPYWTAVSTPRVRSLINRSYILSFLCILDYTYVVILLGMLFYDSDVIEMQSSVPKIIILSGNRRSIFLIRKMNHDIGTMHSDICIFQGFVNYRVEPVL
jgi:hypothetical protein